MKEDRELDMTEILADKGGALPEIEPEEQGSAEHQLVDIDPDEQRLDLEDYAELGGKKCLDTLTVSKVPTQAFFRAHPTLRYETMLLTLVEDMDKTMYLVDKSIRHRLIGDVQAALLVLCVTRNGDLYLWPLKPGKSSKTASPKVNWYTTGLTALERAKKVWCRLVPGNGHYIRYEAEVDIPEPTWPDWDIKKMLNIAFKSSYINSLDHPVIVELMMRKAKV